MVCKTVHTVGMDGIVKKINKQDCEQITKACGMTISITSGSVLVPLIISILVQVKQPRGKVTACKTALTKTGFQEVFDSPH